jgi:UDP-N-acetylbacillosamine N-acetyltransferase
MKKLLILGAGGYGKTVLDVAQQLGCYDKIAFLDDGKVGTPGVLGVCAEVFAFADGDTDVYPAFGNNEMRVAWMHGLLDYGISVPTLVHPAAYVSPTAVLGVGVTVLPGAVVNTGVTVKNGCIINIGALIDHGTVVEEGCHLAPGAIVKAENRIPAGSKIDSGTVIENRLYPL